MELGRLAEDREKRFLGGVEGVVPVAKDAKADREHAVLLSAHDEVECLAITGHDPGQEVGLGAWRRHPVKRTSARVA